MNEKILSQNEKVANKLKFVASNLTRKDKSEFLKANKISSPTLNNYLAGNFSDLETALGIINWFSAKIEQREKAIAAL